MPESDIVTSIYGRNLIALHMKFLKDLRRHHKCWLPMLDKDGFFISGYIWTYSENSNQVTARIYNTEIPEIIFYDSLEAAWEDYKKELEQNIL